MKEVLYHHLAELRDNSLFIFKSDRQNKNGLFAYGYLKKVRTTKNILFVYSYFLDIEHMSNLAHAPMELFTATEARIHTSNLIGVTEIMNKNKVNYDILDDVIHMPGFQKPKVIGQIHAKWFENAIPNDGFYMYEAITIAEGK